MYKTKPCKDKMQRKVDWNDTSWRKL